MNWTKWRKRKQASQRTSEINECLIWKQYKKKRQSKWRLHSCSVVYSHDDYFIHAPWLMRHFNNFTFIIIDFGHLITFQLLFSSDDRIVWIPLFSFFFSQSLAHFYNRLSNWLDNFSIWYCSHIEWNFMAIHQIKNDLNSGHLAWIPDDEVTWFWCTYS